MANASAEANPQLLRLALKLATGAGKTTVMAMIIAWQTVNAVRHPNSRKFTRGFLLVAPGLTIRDRLRVLQPNDPDGYYASREMMPGDMLEDLHRARIVITNYHAFKLRERIDLSKGGRLLLQGRGGAPIQTLESEGQMIQRVMPELMSMKDILVINDEAHHCHCEKPDAARAALKGEERQQAGENNKAACMWISGLGPDSNAKQPHCGRPPSNSTCWTRSFSQPTRGPVSAPCIWRKAWSFGQWPQWPATTR